MFPYKVGRFSSHHVCVAVAVGGIAASFIDSQARVRYLFLSMIFSLVILVRFKAGFSLISFLSLYALNNILTVKSLAIYFEDSQFRRNRTFNFIVSKIYADKRS